MQLASRPRLLGAAACTAMAAAAQAPYSLLPRPGYWPHCYYYYYCLEVVADLLLLAAACCLCYQ